MKYVELTNKSDSRVNVTQIRGLKFEPGETRKVHPSAASHPVVTRYIRSGILSAGEVSKEEPKKKPAVVAAPVHRCAQVENICPMT